MSENTELQAQLVEVLETIFGYLNIPGSFRVEDKNGRFAVKITTSNFLMSILPFHWHFSERLDHRSCCEKCQRLSLSSTKNIFNFHH